MGPEHPQSSRWRSSAADVGPVVDCRGAPPSLGTNGAFLSELKKASNVRQGEGDRPLVIFKFSGTHDYTHGRQMDEYMKSMVRAPADGVIIDLLDYEYVYGNDVTVLFMAGFDQQSQALGAVCVVAVGATRAGLESLLAATKFTSEGGLDVAVVPTIEEARQALSAMQKTAVKRPKTARVPPPGLPAMVRTAALADQRSAIDIPFAKAFVWITAAAVVTALLVQTHSTLSLLSVGVVIVIGGVFIVANLTYLIRAWADRGEPSHFIPLIGGVLVAIGIWRFPADAAHRWWWIPLIIDPGCLLIAGSLIWELTFGKRDPR